MASVLAQKNWDRELGTGNWGGIKLGTGLGTGNWEQGPAGGPGKLHQGIANDPGPDYRRVWPV